MSKRIIAAAALAALVAMPMHQALAQTGTACNNRVFIDAVYQSPAGSNAFNYFVFLRNATDMTMTAEVHLSGFPATVTLTSPSLQGIQMAPKGTISNLRIGQGTNSQINVTTVARVYDAPPGSGPTVRLANCRPA